MLAGAATVSDGTAIFHDPSACPRIVRELEEELASRGIERAADVVGLAHGPSQVTDRSRPGSVL
jgi:dihydroorotate dehydrogenase (NAD+) catalytic subunit